jgi:hypothetical protein
MAADASAAVALAFMGATGGVRTVPDSTVSAVGAAPVLSKRNRGQRDYCENEVQALHMSSRPDLKNSAEDCRYSITLGWCTFIADPLHDPPHSLTPARLETGLLQP